jgi:hypothetical protein
MGWAVGWWEGRREVGGVQEGRTEGRTRDEDGREWDCKGDIARGGERERGGGSRGEVRRGGVEGRDRQEGRGRGGQGGTANWGLPWSVEEEEVVEQWRRREEEEEVLFKAKRWMGLFKAHGVNKMDAEPSPFVTPFSKRGGSRPDVWEQGV